MSSEERNRPISDRGVELARFMREFAKDRGISQQQIADMLGRPQTYVSARLRGKQAMDYETMCAIADLAQISPDFLFAQAQEQVRARLDSRAIQKARQQ